MIKIKETDLCKNVLDYFENNNYYAFSEVKAGQKRIDLYFIHTHYPRTVAVELKICNWKSVLRQAYQNYFYAQKSYAGIWYKHINDKVLDQAKEFEVGVIKINEKDVEVLLEPKMKYFGFTSSSKKIIHDLTLGKNNFIWSKDSL